MEDISHIITYHHISDYPYGKWWILLKFETSRRFFDFFFPNQCSFMDIYRGFHMAMFGHWHHVEPVELPVKSSRSRHDWDSNGTTRGGTCGASHVMGQYTHPVLKNDGFRQLGWWQQPPKKWENIKLMFPATWAPMAFGTAWMLHLRPVWDAKLNWYPLVISSRFSINHPCCSPIGSSPINSNLLVIHPF